MKQVTFFGKKLLVFLTSVLLLSMAVFWISRLAPGDPLMSWYGERVEKMTEAEKDAARQELGLNDPIHIQYVRWLQNAAKGDFGISFKYKRDVTQVIAERIGNTLLLGGTGFVLTVLGALGLGLLCASNEDRWADKLLCKGGTLISCIPQFWLSLVLILVFSVFLRWLPASGAYAVGQRGNVLSRLEHLILPLTVVTVQHVWYYAYLVRSKILEELHSDYVKMAKAKGLSDIQVLLRHCLPNVLPSFISLLSVSLPHVLGGTYIVETVFSYPGLGALSYESARYHDYNLLMVLCLMTGVTVMLSNLIGQLINERIDPRTGEGSGP